MTMLATITPTAEEVEMVEAHDGPKESLRDLERFVLLVSEKVPKATLRVAAVGLEPVRRA